jgi:hypothetical protein
MLRRTAILSGILGSLASIGLALTLGSLSVLSFLAGMLLAFGSIVSFSFLGQVVQTTSQNPRPIHGFALLILFIKLPLIYLLTMWVTSKPAPATSCFLGGLGLVYFALVVSALSDQN